ncbi:unnamed protein product [Phyllotreta striolata]|uniref:Uncharacterized protein n=1 Tax=Phyllotreta striolata TaxID=444603 RepID=A0A9N9TMT5_PHYSR|nr:unnamed protein product [Phyllotreta striolata]
MKFFIYTCFLYVMLAVNFANPVDFPSLRAATSLITDVPMNVMRMASGIFSPQNEKKDSWGL